MKRLLYILLFLIPFVSSGQEAFFQHNYTASGGGGGCANSDANAYIALLQAQGDPVADAANICTFYEALVTAGLYSKIKAMGDMARGNASYNSVGMISGQPSATNTGSPTILSNGTQYNGSTQHTNLGVASNIASQNSIGIGVYIQSIASGNNQYYIGSTNGSAHSNLLARSGSATTTTWALNRQFPESGTCTPDQFLFGTRTAITTNRLYRNGTSILSSTATSNATNSIVFYLGAYNFNGTVNSRAATTISFWIVTEGLDATEAATLNAIIEAYHDGKGIGVQ